MKFHEAKCPSCGGELQLPDGHDTVKCMYCGGDITVAEVVPRQAQANVENLLTLASTALDSGNSEEAYRYYTQVLEHDGGNSNAWFGKASAAGWSSTLANFRIPEMVTCFDKALEFASYVEKEKRRREAGEVINRVVMAFYAAANSHMQEFITVDGAWEEYLHRCGAMLDALDHASEISPTDPAILDNAIHLCRDNIEGVLYSDPFEDNAKKGAALTREYESALRARMDRYVSRMQELRPGYKPLEIRKNLPSACFVATAAAGGAWDPAVVTLRHYRDHRLVTSVVGRRLIQAYETVGPYLAAAIRRSDRARRFVYRAVVRPAAALVRTQGAARRESFGNARRNRSIRPS